MTFQYSFYLDINILGRKIFYIYYYRSSVPYAVRAYGAAIITIYCYDAVTVLSKYRNSNFFSKSILPSKRQIEYFKNFNNLTVFPIT
jgi:hypothetical protein